MKVFRENVNIKMGQVGQCTYNVTLRLVCVPILQ
jgi:hypothetical protein